MCEFFKFKIYLELSYFFATQPTLTGHHGRHRPYIHIRSTLAGQQLPNLKSQEVTALYLPYKKNDIKKTRQKKTYFVVQQRNCCKNIKLLTAPNTE